MARKHKGSSKAGRPRKDGERFDCGKLKPERAHPVDYLTRAAHDYDPLGLAAAIGFLPGHLHRAGEGFARIYRTAGLKGARVNTTRLHEVEQRDEWRCAISTIPDAELVEAFDRVFNVFGDDGERRQAARQKWCDICLRLTDLEQSELVSVCAVNDTPFWLLDMARGVVHHPLSAKAERAEALLSGLRKVCAWFMEQRATAEVVPLPKAPRGRAGGPKVVERTDYVSPAGELLFVVERKISRRGA